MAQVIKAPASKPDNPGSILTAFMGEELLKAVALLTHCGADSTTTIREQ